ncbi:MAG TPA: hypothetical protein GXX50_04935 [Firmicutes bacterium]|nr:hypothetical protein [Bacillota bacterium]
MPRRRLWLLTAVIGGLAVVLGALTPRLETVRPETFATFRAGEMRLPVQEDPIALVAVGDIMLSRGVAREMKKAGDSRLPFAKIKPYLQGDIVLGNLEGPITPGPEIEPSEMRLRADPGTEAALRDAGFTLLTLANNHLPDFGPQGISDTRQHLAQAGIGCTGAGLTARQAEEPYCVQVKGVRLAFLAFADPELIPAVHGTGEEQPGPALFSPEKAAAAVRAARRKADFIVVSLHGGREYAAEPDEAQIQAARGAIDAGADLVLGHHPHVVQRVERYRGRYILYSLGNFVFDQWWSEATRESVVVRLLVGRSGVEKLEFLPVYINKRAQPEPVRGAAAQSIAARLELPLQAEPLAAWSESDSSFYLCTKYVHYCRQTLGAFRRRQTAHADLDEDGRQEVYRLQNGRLIVEEEAQPLWQSPPEWWVDGFTLADADNDGRTDLNLSVWKAGSFGPHKPFWITEDDNSVKNHLFIFDLVDDAVKPIWQSSNLDRPICEMAFTDLDANGENELVVTEGSYTAPADRQLTIWQWNGWGFARLL